MTSPPIDNPSSPTIDTLLNRSRADRQREHRYRFAQSVIFGLPVLALAALGHRLGGPEHARWVGFLQALLAGWVVYVAAVGMLFEGLVLLERRRLSADLPAALVSAALYLLSLIAWIAILLGGAPWPARPMFHWSVAVLIVWTGFQSVRLGRRQHGPAT